MLFPVKCPLMSSSDLVIYSPFWETFGCRLGGFAFPFGTDLLHGGLHNVTHLGDLGENLVTKVIQEKLKLL